MNDKTDKTEQKEQANELPRLVAEIRELTESKKAESSEVQEKLEKMETRFTEIEAANQDLVKQLKSAEEKSETLESDYRDLTREALRIPGNGGNSKSAEMKGYESFVSTGRIENEEKTLRTDINVDGGYLAPNEYVNEILKKITEISPIRSVARVRQTTSKAMEIPIRTDLVSGGWTGETQTDTKSNSKYGLEKLYVKKLQVTVGITIEELQDAVFNMEQEVNADVVERFNQLEGRAFVNGAGPNEPKGFMQDPNVASINSGVANDITADSLRDLIAELKTGYNPIYGFSRATMVRIMKLKDGMGQYLWTPGNLAAGIPNTLNGYPYLEIPDMPAIAADAYSVVFADFGKGYMIGDRMAMSVIRDEYTQKRDGIVELMFMRRVGGQVVLPEAIAKLKCSV